MHGFLAPVLYPFVLCPDLVAIVIPNTHVQLLVLVTNSLLAPTYLPLGRSLSIAPNTAYLSPSPGDPELIPLPILTGLLSEQVVVRPLHLYDLPTVLSRKHEKHYEF
jgi:hypothetical protein